MQEGTQERPSKSRKRGVVSLDSFKSTLQLAYKSRGIANEIKICLMGPEPDRDKDLAKTPKPSTSAFFDQLNYLADDLRQTIIEINDILSEVLKEIR